MKNNILLIFLVLFVATFSTCSDSFLDENNKPINGIELPHAIAIPFESGINKIDIELNEFMEGMSYSIVAFPKSMKFDNLKGKISNKTLSLPYSFEGVYSDQIGVAIEVGYVIVRIEKIGLLTFSVITINYGNPIMVIDKDELDFGKSTVTSKLKITNMGDGKLIYNFIKMPDWIHIDEAQRKDSLVTNQSKYIDIVCNRDNLEAGNYNGIIEILNETKNTIQKVYVKMVVPVPYVDPETLVISIDGMITDAEFDKNSNTLYIATQNPNKVISYNIDTDIKKDILLDRNINCITLSDDNKQIFVGQSAKLTHIDATTFSVVNSYDLSFNVHDIAYDGADYCFMTYKGNYINYITRINLTSGATNTYQISEIYEYTNLFKVKNSSHVFAARETVSPGGVTIIDISSNEPNVVKYWHADEGKRLWFSEDQRYMFTQRCSVYLRPTEETQNNLPPLGTLFPQGNETYEYYRCNWIDHCANSKSIWVSYNKINPDIDNNILVEFDDMTYTRKVVMNLNDYQATINGTNNYYPTDAHYIFANKNGDKIVLIKNIDVYPPANAWHLEILDTSK